MNQEWRKWSFPLEVGGFSGKTVCWHNNNSLHFLIEFNPTITKRLILGKIFKNFINLFKVTQVILFGNNFYVTLFMIFSSCINHCIASSSSFINCFACDWAVQHQFDSVRFFILLFNQLALWLVFIMIRERVDNRDVEPKRKTKHQHWVRRDVWEGTHF